MLKISVSCSPNLIPRSIPSPSASPNLHRYVTELLDFKGDPAASNEGKLEAIQMAWHEEFQDRTRS